MMYICIKQHPSNIRGLFMKMLMNTVAQLKKDVAYKKSHASSKSIYFMYVYNHTILKGL